MASGAASLSPGASQAPSGAPLVEHAQERRQARDGRVQEVLPETVRELLSLAEVLGPS